VAGLKKVDAGEIVLSSDCFDEKNCGPVEILV